MRTDAPDISASATVSDFESQYISLRRKERRIYTNEELLQLPDIHPSHLHYSEWQARKDSCHRLVNYLKKKNRPLKILEVGCGNGWLSHRLATIDNSRVIGLDVNLQEIQQAEETFERNNLRFLHDSIETDKLPKNIFDILVFAASLQYFESLSPVFKTAFSFLNANGEIHILDTNFYSSSQVESAAARTRNYYLSIGFPRMADYYFHHTWQQLEEFNYKVLYNPGSLINRVMKKKNNFPWIRIKA